MTLGGANMKYNKYNTSVWTTFETHLNVLHAELKTTSHHKYWDVVQSMFTVLYVYALCQCGYLNISLAQWNTILISGVDSCHTTADSVWGKLKQVLLTCGSNRQVKRWKKSVVTMFGQFSRAVFVFWIFKCCNHKRFICTHKCAGWSMQDYLRHTHTHTLELQLTPGWDNKHKYRTKSTTSFMDIKRFCQQLMGHGNIVNPEVTIWLLSHDNSKL